MIKNGDGDILLIYLYTYDQEISEIMKQMLQYFKKIRDFKEIKCRIMFGRYFYAR